MPNKYYERAKKILSRNDDGVAVSFEQEDQFYKLDDRIDAVDPELSGNDRILAVRDMLEIESREKLQEANETVEKIDKNLTKAKEEKEKYIAEHGNENPEKVNTEAFDLQIKGLTTAKREANKSVEKVKEENSQRKDIRDAYKETYGKKYLANDGEFISKYKQRENITSVVYLYNKAEQANPPRTEELEGYKQALEENGINLDYAFGLASGRLSVDTDKTKEELEDRINKISQIDDTFLTQGKEALGVSVINGVRTPNIDRVMSVYLQSGLNWKEFIGHVVYEGKDTSVFQEDEEGLDKLGQEISDIENKIKEIKADVEDETLSGKYADELDELNDAWNKATENAENNIQEIDKGGGEKQITDLFNDMHYDLFEKLSPDAEEHIEVDRLLASEAYKSATEEQRSVIRNTVKLFLDKQGEIEDKTADLRKQLEEKKAEYTERSAKVTKINERIADVKASFKSESSLFINGESHAKNLFTPVKEFFEKNYPVEVKNNEMAIDDSLLKTTGKGMQERFNAIDKAADKFSEYNTKQLNKNASKEDILRAKDSVLLDVYKDKNRSFDQRKMCVKAVLDRKNDLQSQLDGKSFFAKMFSAIVPNSWTETGRLKDQIKAIDTTVKEVVSEQDIKDMYEDPIDEPRDMTKAGELQPVFDYIKITMDFSKAKGPVYDNIKKDIELMQSGVFAKDNKNGLDSLCDNLYNLYDDGNFDKQMGDNEKRNVKAQIFNAFDAIKNYQEKGVLEIKDVLSEMNEPETTEKLVDSLGKETGNKDINLSKANEEKNNEKQLGLE